MGLTSFLPLATRRRLGEFMERLALPRYRRGGYVPWTPGYSAHREALVRATLADAVLMRAFAQAERLPAGYGMRCDE